MIYILRSIFYLSLLYLFFAVVLGYIPENRSFKDIKDGKRIFVVSNGIHTDIVLPLTTGNVSWQEFFSRSGFRGHFHGKAYIAFGWGNRLFYRNVPEWKDLTVSIALNALFVKRESAMHVTLIYDLSPGKNVIPLDISADQLSRLSEYIRSSFKTGKDGYPIPADAAGYGINDRFFQGAGKFSIVKSCNVWTGNGLKYAGIRSPVWSPFDRPILYQLSHTGK